jgi:hypothetical protein
LSEREPHWGGGSLKGALLTVVIALALMASLIGLFFWSPWEGPTEADWLSSYRAWSDSIEGSLGGGGAGSRASCESSFDEQVGDPPRDRLAPVALAARRGCARLSSEGWKSARADVVRALADVHGAVAPPRYRPDFSEIARSSVGVQAKVYCWRPQAWEPFSQHDALVRAGKEISLKGFADAPRDRIDLEPGVCAALGRYVRRIRPPDLSYENFELAEALVVLTHQAERLKSPSTSEAELECYAVQHVRPLIRAARWGPGFQTEIALHAWDLAYTQLPAHFRAPACRNNGPLDRHRASNAWP